MESGRSTTTAAARRVRSPTPRAPTIGARTQTDDRAPARTRGRSRRTIARRTTTGLRATNRQGRERVQRRGRPPVTAVAPARHGHPVARDRGRRRGTATPCRCTGARDRGERGRQRGAARCDAFELVQERRVADHGIEVTAPRVGHRQPVRDDHVIERIDTGPLRDRCACRGHRRRIDVASPQQVPRHGDAREPQPSERGSRPDEELAVAAGRIAHRRRPIEPRERDLDEPASDVCRCVERPQLTSSSGRQHDASVSSSHALDGAR